MLFYKAQKMFIKCIQLPTLLKVREKSATQPYFTFLEYIFLWNFSIKQKKLHHLILPFRFVFLYLVKLKLFPTLKPELF